MRQRLSLVTLGVRDMARARAFYETLGWRGVGGSGEEPLFFQAGDMVVALWDRDLLATDTGVDDGGGWGGITLAHNVGSPREVDEITAAATAAGATVGREPAQVLWGGYTSLFFDPDGHPWEIAYNPGWPLDENGGVHLA